MPEPGTYYKHLGTYSDLVAAQAAQGLFGPAAPGQETQRRVREMLSFEPRPAKPTDVRVEKRWERDGVTGELVTWSAGYGPRTQSFLLRPSGVGGRLPGVIALHDHGGFKYFGKEKIADGPAATPRVIAPFREQYYGGRAFASELARRGFAVLVPDVFLWGSRRFPLAVMAEACWCRETLFDDSTCDPEPEQVELYNDLASRHENVVERYLAVLGTTLAGVMSFEDRVAAAYITGRDDIRKGGIACLGLSGGGLRTTLLNATCDSVRAAVIVGMMSSYEDMIDSSIRSHTWAFFPRGWTKYGDWPDIGACRAPSPVMVQYDTEDQIFPLAGMQRAHDRIAACYREAGAPEHYDGRFYPGPHKFDLRMQEEAFDWLERRMA